MVNPFTRATFALIAVTLVAFSAPQEAFGQAGNPGGFFDEPENKPAAEGTPPHQRPRQDGSWSSSSAIST